jgi:hypothetical protein
VTTINNFLKELLNVIFKKSTSGLFYIVLLLSGACDSPTEPGDPPVTQEVSNGVFQILINQNAGSVNFLGAVYDGPTVEAPWDTVMKSGPLKLLKPAKPFCSNCIGICVKEDSCAFESSLTNVGTVTVSGVRLTSGTGSFTSNPIGGYYSTGAQFADPPFAEGDSITLAAAGAGNIPAFSIKGTGIDKLVVLNDSLRMIDGQPIELRWNPAGIAGNSRIVFEVNISYHGGTKAKIIGDCEDNGSVTIPGPMLDKLKTYGLAGFPKLMISRKAQGVVSATGKVKIVTEAAMEIGINIPGLRSCNSDGECPDGQICKKPDRVCE